MKETWDNTKNHIENNFIKNVQIYECDKVTIAIIIIN